MTRDKSTQPQQPERTSMGAILFSTFCPLYVLALWTFAPLTVTNLLPLQKQAAEAYTFLTLSGMFCGALNGLTVSGALCWWMLKNRVDVTRSHLAILGLLVNATLVTTLSWLLGLLLLDVLQIGTTAQQIFTAYWGFLAPFGSAYLSLRAVRLTRRSPPSKPAH